VNAGPPGLPEIHLLNSAILGLVFSFDILSAIDVSFAASEPSTPGFPGLLKNIKMNRAQVNFE
jgi:hypothetical protein